MRSLAFRADAWSRTEISPRSAKRIDIIIRTVVVLPAPFASERFSDTFEDNNVLHHEGFPLLIFPLNRVTQLIFPEARRNLAETGKLVKGRLKDA